MCIGKSAALVSHFPLCTSGPKKVVFPSGRRSVTPKMNALSDVPMDGGFVHIVVSPPCTFSQLHLGCQAILVARVSLSAGSLSVGIVTSVSQSGGMATLRPCHQYSQQLSSIFPAIVIDIHNNCHQYSQQLCFKYSKH